jgi:hypothetical protein
LSKATSMKLNDYWQSLNKKIVMFNHNFNKNILY